MPRLFTTLSLVTLSRSVLSLAVLAFVGGDWACAQPSGGGNPTYQRSRQGSSYDHGGDHRSGEHNYNHDRGHHGKYQKSRWNHRHQRYNPPQVSSGSFQRPYPYHLDYYRMRWGGSYEPYFGNLYGPPNVVLGVPYYYGGGAFYGDGGNFGGGGRGYYDGGVPVTPYQAAPMPVE
ncbi:hypothetical protein [Aeoliella sp.]|uniref:hypothetical protein n=1 Tax=Aeoliella sp. TaxID=2795800 RepID=UPI003CCC2DBC